MTDNLKTTLQDHMKAAMRTQDKFRLGVIRLILSTMKQQEVGGLEGRVVLSDEQILAILNKMIKQRRESITQYEAGHRPELAKIESDEILIIQQYLPNQLSESEITAAIAAAITESGATAPKDMGKVMGILKNTLAGKAEMGIVSGKVKAILTG